MAMVVVLRSRNYVELDHGSRTTTVLAGGERFAASFDDTVFVIPPPQRIPESITFRSGETAIRCRLFSQGKYKTPRSVRKFIASLDSLGIEWIDLR